MFTLLWYSCPGRSGNKRVTFINLNCYSLLDFRKWWNVFIADHHFNHQHQSLSSSAKISVDHQHNQNLTKRRLALQWAPVALYSENIAAVKSLACQTFETRKFEVVFWPFYRTYGYVWFQYCSAILWIVKHIKVTILPVDGQGVVWRSRSQPLQNYHLSSR